MRSFILFVVCLATVANAATVTKIDAESITREIFFTAENSSPAMHPADNKIDVYCQEETEKFACNGSAWMMYRSQKGADMTPFRMSMTVDIFFNKNHEIVNIVAGKPQFHGQDDVQATETEGLFGLWNKIKKGAGHLVNQVKDGVTHLGGETKKEANKVGHAVNHLSEEAKKDANKVNKALHDGVVHIGGEAKKLASNETVKKIIKEVGPVVEEAAKNAVKAKIAALAGKIVIGAMMG